MTSPRILRARQRARALSSPQDVRRAMNRIGRQFWARAGAVVGSSDTLGRCAALVEQWRAHAATVESSLRLNANRLSYADMGFAVLLRAAELTRAIGALRAAT